ncbi:MAG: hypothetical protein M3395_08235 [Chloroflexota bacterium]|nr:hypothetical protein [Chloroflexota bacterium]
MIVPFLAIAGTWFVTGILGLRVIALPDVPFEVGLVMNLGVALLIGMYRPTIATVAGAGPAAVVGVAAAWFAVLVVDPRSPGENILFYWSVFGLMTASAAAAGRLMSAPRARQRKPSAPR